MGGRYLISGTQLGILKVIKERKVLASVLKQIETEQYLGESHNLLTTDVKRLFGVKK